MENPQNLAAKSKTYSVEIGASVVRQRFGLITIYYL